VDEDPVTGSAHCALAPFWSERLGREELVGYQVSARGGKVRTRLRGDRVLLGGQAVTVLRGELV
jgi:predicted PhzF superfamily epimerase YddE/YHI9